MPLGFVVKNGSNIDLDGREIFRLLSPERKPRHLNHRRSRSPVVVAAYRARPSGPVLLAVISSGSAIFAAILRASSFVSNLAAERRPGSSSKYVLPNDNAPQPRCFASNTPTNRQPFIGKRISDGSHQNRAMIHRNRTVLLQHPHQSPTVQRQEHNVQDQYGRQV